MPRISKAGLQALLDSHRRNISNGQIATGSLNYDEAILPYAPNDHRVDYGIGLPVDKTTEKVLWLEVHHAASGETERVVKKLAALKAWISENGPAFSRMERVFIWQLTNVENNPNDRRKRNLLAAKHGIRRVQGGLNLASF